MFKRSHFIWVSIFLILIFGTSACEKKPEKTTEDASTETTDPSLDVNYSYFSLKFFLSGAMSGTEMKTTLAPYLPTTDPYGVGATSPNITSLPNVVDWVHIEFRDPIPPHSLVKSYAGLLLKDGKLVDVDGSSTPKVNIDGTYWVFIKHRNHLPVRTTNSIELVKGTVVTQDYSGYSSFHQESGFPDQEIGFTGIRAIKYGEVTGDCDITTADTGSVQSQSFAYNGGGSLGYFSGDLNFDAVVTSGDLNLAMSVSGYSSINNSSMCGK